MAIVFIVIARNRKKKRKIDLKRKWWFWAGNAFVLFHFVFLQYINPSYFGYGTPDQFTKVVVTDNEVVLFDERVTRFDDEDMIKVYYTGHLRIHVVDRKRHEKRYTQLIGDNYSVHEEMGHLFLFENSNFSYLEEDNIVRSVSEFDIEQKELVSIAQKDQTISTAAGTIDVFEIFQR